MPYLQYPPLPRVIAHHPLTLNLLVPSADNFCKQFGPRSGPTNGRAWSGFKLFDTLMVFLKEFFEKADFERNQQTTKKHEKFSVGKELNDFPYSLPQVKIEKEALEGFTICFIYPIVISTGKRRSLTL